MIRKFIDLDPLRKRESKVNIKVKIFVLYIYYLKYNALILIFFNNLYIYDLYFFDYFLIYA